jgi:hypothetical protein
MESSEIEQRMNMKFCFKLGKTAADTLEMLVSFREMLLLVERRYTSGLNIFMVVLN